MYNNYYDDDYTYDRSVSDGNAKRYFYQTLQRAEVTLTQEDLADLKAYLRIPSDSTEDLNGIMAAAIDIAESSSHISLAPKIVREDFSQLPNYTSRRGYPNIFLLAAPVVGLYRFTNYSTREAATINDVWIEDPQSGIVVSPSTGILTFRLCSTRQVVIDSVCSDHRVEYLAGYVPSDNGQRVFEFRFSILPADIKLALRQIATALYYQRGDEGQMVMPQTAKVLLAKYNRASSNFTVV